MRYSAASLPLPTAMSAAEAACRSSTGTRSRRRHVGNEPLVPFPRARGRRCPGCPAPIENRASGRRRIDGLRRLRSRESDDASNKIVYYPVTTWGLDGQRVSGNELLVKNNDVWFRRAVDACRGEGLQTVNGSATVQRARIGHAAPFVLAPPMQGGPACMPTKLSTPSPRLRAALGVQNGHVGRKTCTRLMFVALCSRQRRFGFNGQRNNSAEAFREHGE